MSPNSGNMVEYESSIYDVDVNEMDPPLVAASPILSYSQDEDSIMQETVSDGSPTVPSSSMRLLVVPARTVSSSSLDEQNAVVATTSELLVPAGAAGAVIGWLVGGTFLGVVAGFGAAYGTTQPAGATRDVSRALGEVALIVRSKAVELDREHHLVEQARARLYQTWVYARNLDTKYSILNKLQAFCVWSIRTSIRLIKEHKLIERGCAAVGSGLEQMNSSSNTQGRSTTMHAPSHLHANYNPSSFPPPMVPPASPTTASRPCRFSLSFPSFAAQTH